MAGSPFECKFGTPSSPSIPVVHPRVERVVTPAAPALNRHTSIYPNIQVMRTAMDYVRVNDHRRYFNQGQFPNWTHGSYPPPVNSPRYPQQAYMASPAYPAQGTYMPQPHQHPPSYNPGFIWSAPAHCTGSFDWIHSSNGLVPPNAVPGGMDRDGGPIYVGRAYHQGDLLPAKICPTHGGGFVCHSGQEHSKFQYEVLCSNHVAWKFSSGGSVPPEAIRVGQTENGEPLYVGRAMIEGTMTIGKVHPSHGCLYIPYDGREISFPDYEVMILN